jgi:hypothetical protein
LVLLDLAIDSASAPRRRDTLLSLGGDRVVFYAVFEEGDEDATAALEEETLAIAHKDTFRMTWVWCGRLSSREE